MDRILQAMTAFAGQAGRLQLEGIRADDMVDEFNNARSTNYPHVTGVATTIYAAASSFLHEAAGIIAEIPVSGLPPDLQRAKELLERHGVSAGDVPEALAVIVAYQQSGYATSPGLLPAPDSEFLIDDAKVMIDFYRWAIETATGGGNPNLRQALSTQIAQPTPDPFGATPFGL